MRFMNIIRNSEITFIIHCNGGIPKMAKKKQKYGYDVSDPFDRAMALDVPYSQLNKRGRKAKKKLLKK